MTTTCNMPSWLHRIGCVSTSRADAGLYRPLWRALGGEPGIHVTCLAGGTHCRADFGRTIAELGAEPRLDVVPVDHLVPGDGPSDVAMTIGRAVGAFAQAYEETGPDLVFVLGDRTEMLAAAIAALVCRIPIAHLHGGDTTEGAYDDACRHAVTKLSHVHFAAMEQHAERIRRMGEECWRVHRVGALALDELAGFVPLPIEQVSARTGLDVARPTVLVAYHVETLADQSPVDQVHEVLEAVRRLSANLLLIGTNADVGHGAIFEAMRRLAADRPNTVYVPSLPQSTFWSCLAHGGILVGNSSAGMIEAASLKAPVINIGRRQAGRVRPANVLDAPCRRSDISAALHVALEPAFRAGLSGLENPYGDGRAAARILAAMRDLPDRARLLVKRWPDDSQTGDP